MRHAGGLRNGKDDGEPAQASALVITCSRRHIVALLAAGVGVLAVAHLLGQYSIHALGRSNVYGLIDRFHLDGEANVPAWYAVLLLLACATVFAVIAVGARRSGDPYGRHWIGLAVIAFLLCLDEGAQFHELMTRPTRELADGAGGWVRSYWVVPGALLVLLIGLVYLPFLRGLPRAIAVRFVAAGAAYLLGALGLETVGGWYITNRGNGLGYNLLAAAEEVLEKAGVLLALDSGLRYLVIQTPAVRLSLRPDPPAALSR